MGIKKTKFTPALKNVIRRQYEHGEGLVDIAMTNNFSYSYLKTLAKKGKWEKGKYLEKGYHEFLTKETEEQRKEKEKVKSDYKELTGKLKITTLEAMERKEGFNKSQAESYKAISQTIECLYKIDKDIYGLRNEKEDIEYKQEIAKFEALKKDLLETDSEVTEDSEIIIRVVNENGGKYE